MKKSLFIIAILLHLFSCKKGSEEVVATKLISWWRI